MELRLLKSCCFLNMISFSVGLLFDNNCSSTYDSSLGRIQTDDEEKGKTCVWKFRADPQDNFVLTFLEYRSLSQLFTLCKSSYLEVKDGSTENSTSIVGPRMCYIILSKAEVNTETNGMWIKLVTDSFSFGNQLTALVRIDSWTKRYQVYPNKMTWLDARDRCVHNGGSLAVSYPAPTISLERAVFHFSSPIWTGKSVTAWVWLLGCVTWKNEEGIQPVYQDSKYNQIAECAMACSGSAFFLLQAKACYCFGKVFVTEKVEFRDCNYSCPGNHLERCGGMNTFSKYQYRSLPMDKDNDVNKNCGALTKSGKYVAKDCDLHLPFSCSFKNDSKTYQYVLPWHEAVDFCSREEGSTGLSAIPQLTSDFFQVPMWLALTRGVDWGFPSATKRNPEKAYIAVEGLYSSISIYTEDLVNTTGQFPFACQFEEPTCGGNLSALDGNISSPNFPGPYDAGENCLWNIFNDTNLVFIIEFQHFDLENSVNCIYDYLQFTEFLKGDVKVKSAKHCGNKIPDSFVARTNHIEVHFKSDRSVISAGFLMKWRLVNDAEAKKWEEGNEPKKVDGGLIVGVTIATTLIVIIILCVGYIVHRQRKIRKAPIQEQKGSSVNNAIYGMDVSEFDQTSVVNDNFTTPYENINSPRKPNLQEEVSYSYENVGGNAIALGVAAMEESNRQSKANLVLEMYHSEESDNEQGNSDNLKETDLRSSEKSEGEVSAIADVRDIGKDSIQVTETVKQNEDDADDYIQFDNDEKTTAGLNNTGKDATNHVYKNEDPASVHEYQNTQAGPSNRKEEFDNGYNYIYFDNVEPYENMTDTDYTGLVSPTLSDLHQPLVPQASNWYTEIGEVTQLKK